MKKNITFILLIILFSSQALYAQSHHNVVISDVNAELYFDGGKLKKGILTLTAKSSYNSLDSIDKQNSIQPFINNLNAEQIIIERTDEKKEMWLVIDNKPFFVETWGSNDLGISSYTPIDNRRSKSGRWFNYLGGMFSGSSGFSSGTFSYRIGSYLFKSKLDAAISLNLGYIKSEETAFSGDIGASTRLYFKSIKNTKIHPYFGAGIALIISEESQFEPQLFIGICSQLGNGTIDAGLRYGASSKFAFTYGYTFQLKKQK
ncbi:MAG: hypothetical protein K6D59_04825 [Bacteroidales bacterium]|nr:hypothetical protein [Bacteroidales bacterium]